jgi:hypothetical protein
MIRQRLFILILILASLAYQHQQSVSSEPMSPSQVTAVFKPDAGHTPNSVALTDTPSAPVQPCTARAIKATLTTYVNAQGQAVRDTLEVILEGQAKAFRLETANSVVDGRVTDGKVLIDLEHDEVAPYSLTIPGCGSERLEPLRNTMRL